MAEDKRGVIPCTVPGHEGETVTLQPKIGVRQCNQWRAEATHSGTQKLEEQQIAACTLKDVDGQPAPQPSEGPAALEVLQLELLPWLINVVQMALIERATLRPEA